MSRELELLRQVEVLLRSNQNTLLMDLQPDTCGCSNGRPKLVYRNPSANQIGQLLQEVLNERARNSNR